MVHILIGLCDGSRVKQNERKRNGLSTYNRLAKWLFTKCPNHFAFVSIFHVFGVNEISAEHVKNNYYFYDSQFNFTFWRVISIGFMRPENWAIFFFCSREIRSIRLSVSRDWRRDWYGVSGNRKTKWGSTEARKQFKQTSIFMCAIDRLHTLWISICFWIVSTRQ